MCKLHIVLHLRDSREVTGTKVLFCPVFILKSIFQLKIHILRLFQSRLLIEEKSRINRYF